MPNDTVRVTIELTRSADQVSGRVAGEGISEQTFTGWLALMSVLEGAAEGLRESEAEVTE